MIEVTKLLLVFFLGVMEYGVMEYGVMGEVMAIG
jgi:hypothetical protein